MIVARNMLGTIRIRATSSRPVFIGIGSQHATAAYLGTVARDQATSVDVRNAQFHVHSGGPPATPPTQARIWAASTAGTGEQTLTWNERAGNWHVILMNADGTPNVSAQLSIGARFPHLLTIGIAVLGAGIVIILLSSGGLAAIVRRRRATVA